MDFLSLILSIALVIALIAIWRTPIIPSHWHWLGLAVLPPLAHVLGYPQPWLVIATIIGFSLWCWYNRAIIGLPIVWVGGAAKLLVISLNDGYMPLYQPTLTWIDLDIPVGTALEGTKVVVSEGGLLWFLGDWIPVATPFGYTIISPGDIILWAGLLIWLWFSGKKQAKPSESSNTGVEAIL